MNQSDRPIAIDCFAGCGGLSYGLLKAGFDVRFAFDHTPEAVQTYEANIGRHVLESEVEDIHAPMIRKYLPKNGRCDLIAGGPPCQGFSVQRRGPKHDDRNDLILTFLEIVNDLQPNLFLMENVSALAGPRGEKYLEKFVSQATSMGYITHVKVLNALDYGVPQNRRRLFVVGERGVDREYFAFPKPTHELERHTNVRDAIGDLPAPDVESGVANHAPDNISELNRLRISYVPPGGGRDDIPESLRLPCHKLGSDKIGHRGVYGRLHWDKPSGTITTKCNSFTRGRFAHPEQNRNITMREAARLQSFPDEFVFCGTKVAVAHQVGNAVPPLLATAVGKAVLDAIVARKSGNPVKRRSVQCQMAFD